MRKGGRLEERGEFYQTICRHFLQHRGSPFILSSREIELIAEWERMKIPLSAVLEGMNRAFEDRQRKPGRRTRVFSLDRCRIFVLDAYKQDCERHVGRTGERPFRGERDKRKRILREIDGFLSSSPPVHDLCDLFLSLRSDLKRGIWDEESLERAEAAVEDILVAQATPQERERIAAEVVSEFDVKGTLEFDRIVRLKLIKELRTKYRVPHISLFFY